MERRVLPLAVGNARMNVIAGEVRIGFQDCFDRVATRQKVEDQRDPKSVLPVMQGLPWQTSYFMLMCSFQSMFYP